MRTPRIWLTLMSVVVLVATACSSGSSSSAPQASTPPASTGTGASSVPGSAASGGELLIWADDKRAAALKPLAEQFGAEQGVTVTVEAISKDLIANFKTASGAGTGPDIVIWAHDVVGDLVANGFIDPVTLTDPSVFDLIAIKGMTFGGQLYGVPYNVENIALFRNTDLVPDAPKSIEEMVATGKKLVADGKTKNIMSLQIGQAGDAYHIYPLFVSGGGSLFGTTSTGDPDPAVVNVDTAESVAAFTKIQALGEKGDKALKTSIDGTNAIPLFFNKEAPFLISGPWAVADIKKAGTPYDISPIPPFEGGKPAGPFVGVNGFYIASKGKNKTLAQEFATNFATTLPVQVAFYDAEPRPPALTEAFDQVSADNPDMAKFVAAREGGTILPAIPAMGQVWGPFGNAESAIVRGDEVKKTLDAAGKAIRDGIAKS